MTHHVSTLRIPPRPYTRYSTLSRCVRVGTLRGGHVRGTKNMSNAFG